PRRRRRAARRRSRILGPGITHRAAESDRQPAAIRSKVGSRESEELMKKNSVAHFEIYADDPDKLEQFYTSMFDWKVERIPHMDYRLIKSVDTDDKGMPTQTGGINGGLLKRPAGYPG